MAKKRKKPPRNQAGEPPNYPKLFMVLDGHRGVALSCAYIDLREYAGAYYTASLKLLDDVIRRQAFDHEALGQLEMTVFATDELLIEFQKRMASSWPK